MSPGLTPPLLLPLSLPELPPFLCRDPSLPAPLRLSDRAEEDEDGDEDEDEDEDEEDEEDRTTSALPRIRTATAVPLPRSTSVPASP